MTRRRWVVLLLALVGGAGAASASAAMTLSSDQRPLFFGRMQPGESKELVESGVYHNQITCTSTNGRTWYVKVHLLEPLADGGATIPLDHLQWQVAGTDGRGSTQHTHQFTPFQLTPDLVYISGADDASGTPVQVQFKYRLEIPETQVGGVYHTTVRFTFTEVL